jgi:alkylhydroperoxidase/carboxymuconolactone decarboxylase family protein YurZ
VKGDNIMDEKTELLICLGAATAANCVPCFDYYFKKASAAGIPFEEVRIAVELACKVKTGAGIIMKNSIRDTTGQDWESEQAGDGKTAHPCCK